MKCTRATKLLSDYVDDLVPVFKRGELEKHLATCETCSRELKRLKLMLGDLKLLAKAESRINCWPGIRARILAGEKVAERGRWAWLMRPAAIGPALAAVVLAVGLMLGPARAPENSQAEAMAAMEYRSYITAHSRVQGEQPLNDPDVVFVTAQLENARFASENRNR